MNLFEYHESSNVSKNIPLAWRMQPKTLEEFIGQKHILAQGKLLKRAIEADRISSLILYGPPGCGKTALAHVIAQTTKSLFRHLNATTAGVSDIRKIIEEAKKQKKAYGQNTILFIDEIHRFNKLQQDALLHDVEVGNIILIGASTHNPFFSTIPALVSRSQIFQLNPLSNEELREIIQKAITNKERGLGYYKIKMEEKAIKHLIDRSNGDARKVLNGLEIGVLTTKPNKDGFIHFNIQVAEESIQKRSIAYSQDEHYDTISAFIKSMRGSDPDAALYWLAKMIHAGEDPVFIARRIVICASEDVGNADPQAIIVAISALEAVRSIGMPEGRIPLAQAATYIACAPKSNAVYKGIENALNDINKEGNLSVPLNLKDTHYSGATQLGYGKNYKYPHNYKKHYVKQDYLPEKRIYYIPTNQGFEAKIKKWLEELEKENEN